MDETVIIRNSRGAMLFAFSAGLTIGILSGAKLVHRKLQEEMNVKIEEEFERLHQQYGSGSLVKPWKNPQEAVKDLHPEIVKPGPTSFETPPPREPVAYDKIVTFEPGDEAPEEVEVDPEEEHAIEAEYSEPEIYVITSEVYAAGEKNYPQASLWYYPLDKVVTDQRDNPLDDPFKYLGTGFEMRFGQGDDPNTVYVRNDKIQIDYEIMNAGGSFKDATASDEQTDRQRINGA